MKTPVVAPMHQPLEPDCSYYVTVIDGPRVGYLLGPYDTLAAAEARVKDARQLAEKANAWTHFYAFGCARLPADRLVRTVFGA